MWLFPYLLRELGEWQAGVHQFKSMIQQAFPYWQVYLHRPFAVWTYYRKFNR